MEDRRQKTRMDTERRGRMDGCVDKQLRTHERDADKIPLGQQDEEDPIETTFELNETLHAKAKIPPTDEVYIWLGANVMLSYPIEEAEQLLDSKLKAATQSLQNCEEDLDFLREQITVRFYKRTQERTDRQTVAQEQLQQAGRGRGRRRDEMRLFCYQNRGNIC